MTTHRHDDTRRTTEVNHADPSRAATDPRAAAQQDQVKADHDALQDQARRVESSVSSEVRDTPIEPSRTNQGASDDETAPRRDAQPQVATDPRAAEQLDRVKADHDALQESARRVESSVSERVRDTPVQPATSSDRGNADDVESSRRLRESRENADASREGARRVEESVTDDTARDRR